MSDASFRESYEASNGIYGMERDDFLLLVFQLAGIAFMVLWEKKQGFRFSLARLFIAVILMSVVCGLYKIIGLRGGRALSTSLIFLLSAAMCWKRGEKAGGVWMMVALAIFFAIAMWR